MINVAQVGVGAWGKNHLRTFAGLQDCNLSICCDSNLDILSMIKNQYSNKIKTTLKYEEILNDKTLDAIVIATPAYTHADLALKALDAGKHVFVEKPIALNINDGKKLVNLAKKNNKILMVGHLLLFNPAVIKIKEYIDQGIIGDVSYIYSTRVNLGRIRNEENALWSLTSHDISVALFLLFDYPIEVIACGASFLRKDIEDVVFVTLKFKKNILVHIHASWLDPHKIRKFTVVGSKKMVVFDDMEPSEKIRLFDKGVDRKVDYQTYAEYLALRSGDINIPKINMQEPLLLECRHFIDCIKDNIQPLTNGENALKILSVLEAAQQSLNKNGKVVKINEK